MIRRLSRLLVTSLGLWWREFRYKLQHPGLCILSQAFRSRSRATQFSVLFQYSILDTLILTLSVKMRFSILSAITAVVGATIISAAPLEARQDTLLPFEVTKVSSNRRALTLGVDPCKRPLISAPILYKSHSFQGKPSPQPSPTPTPTPSSTANTMAPSRQVFRASTAKSNGSEMSLPRGVPGLVT